MESKETPTLAYWTNGKTTADIFVCPGGVEGKEKNIMELKRKKSIRKHE